MAIYRFSTLPPDDEEDVLLKFARDPEALEEARPCCTVRASSEYPVCPKCQRAHQNITLSPGGPWARNLCEARYTPDLAALKREIMLAIYTETELYCERMADYRRQLVGVERQARCALERSAEGLP